MTRCFREPTLTELLNDSITRALMHADDVDPSELETRLRDLAARRADSPEHNECGRRPHLQFYGAP
jgi:hypothetical protein